MKISQQQKARARKLRTKQTDAEQRLWSKIRNRQLAGAKFRRQQPVGCYVLDFYCHEQLLAIELDGGQHNEPDQREKDSARSEYLAGKGIIVLRFWNNDVLQNIEGVLQCINEILMHPSPQPSPGGRGSMPPGEEGLIPTPRGGGSMPPGKGKPIPSPRASAASDEEALIPSPRGSTASGEEALIPSPRGSTASGEEVLIPSPKGSTASGEEVLIPSPKGSASSDENELIPSPKGSAASDENELIPSPSGRGLG